MIKKLLILMLCLILFSCGGFSIVAGVKFKKVVGAATNNGNPSSTDDVVKLSNEKFISFKRPIGECGTGVSFFGIILPIIPVGVTTNKCEESFDISTEGYEVLMINLKYNGSTYDSVSMENLTKDGYRKKFKFKIQNFWKFRMSDDKAIIVSGKTKDGQEFTQELPVKWGIMIYNNWVFP